jgi:transcriptional regulator with XRE-family HTH domain
MQRMDWTATLKLLRADRGNWVAVAEATGVTRMQVSRIASGETKHPRIDTAQKIADYYKPRARRRAA